MKNYKLIKGSVNNIDLFEEQVSQAIDDGFDFSSELITKMVAYGPDNHELILLQPMVFVDDFDLDEELLSEETE